MAKTILVDDDSASIRPVVSIALKSAGYGIIEGVDGITFVKEANKQESRAADAKAWAAKPFQPAQMPAGRFPS